MDDFKFTARTRLNDLVNNLFAAFLFAGVSMITAILYTHFGPSWARPIVNGLIAGAITLTLFLCVRAILALPRARAVITPENAGQFVLGWLHKFNLEVKNLIDDDCHFIYRVTTDGGKILTVRRTRKIYNDYLTFRALINANEVDKKLFDSFTESEKAALRVKLGIELSRAVMGFKTDAWMTEDLWIFKYVPISPGLSEETVINTIWEMEAMVQIIYSTGALALLEHRVKNGLSVDGKTVIEGSNEN